MNYKNILLVALGLLGGAVLYAQEAVQVKGTLKKQRISAVKLFQVNEGDLQEIATSTPLEGGKFGFTFFPSYEGYYAIGTGTIGSPTDNYVFYFKSGDQLDVVLNESSYELVGKTNSKENKALLKWSALVQPLYDKSINFMKTQSTFVDFFPDLERIVKQANGFDSQNKTGNKKFDQSLSSYTKWTLASYATNFLNTPRTAHPSTDEYSAYYSTLDMKNFAQDADQVYRMPWGNRTLSGVQSVVMRTQNIPYGRGLVALETDLKLISNDTLKGDAVVNYASRQKDFALYKEAIDKYGSYIVTDKQDKRNKEKLNELAQLKTGDKGLSFAYPDNTGKIVKFEDLKGKVVLIDVWATWCGPCRAEFPHLKKLEEDVKGKDIVVVSLSTDSEKDKEKWKQMIIDEKLGGIQLYAGSGNEFSKYYKVNTIPRFLVFDKQGNIVSVDAPRPSNPELLKLLEREASK